MLVRSAEPSERIDSWKEIAAYLNRGTRTVQRWEREAGLPVHRLQHDKLGSVYAYKSEVDAWWLSRRSTLENEPTAELTNGPSIAVLPFADMSREKDQQYFCDGIAEEITGALSKIRGLRIASRSPAARFKAGAVANLLQGSVRKSGERLRISVQLTSTGSGFQLWSEIYDRDIGDVFAIQEEIARSVARSLAITLTPKEAEALQKTPTRDPRAHDLYLRGRQYYDRYGPLDMECAIQLFTYAVQRDPEYAAAYAGLADCWSYLHLYAEPNETVRDQAEWASRLAVELDPNSAQAQASRGLALSLRGQDDEAARAFEAAVHLDPNLFEANYFFARHCFAAGQFDEALSLYEQASRSRPDDYQSPLLMARIYEHLGRPEEARCARVRGIELAEERVKLHPDDARAAEWAGRAAAMRLDDSMLL